MTIVGWVSANGANLSLSHFSIVRMAGGVDVFRKVAAAVSARWPSHFSLRAQRKVTQRNGLKSSWRYGGYKPERSRLAWIVRVPSFYSAAIPQRVEALRTQSPLADGLSLAETRFKPSALRRLAV